MPKKKKLIKKRFFLDMTILIPTIILSVIGIIMVYSATSYSLIQSGDDPAGSAKSQALFFGLGLIAIFFIYKFKNNILQNRRLIITAMVVIGIMLLLTRFTSLGESVNGARGWLKLPGIPQIQPAEFLKILIVWYLASTLARRQPDIKRNFKEVALRPFGLVAGLIFLVLLQPDTGGAAILVLIACVMLFASGIDYKYFIKSAIAVVGLSVIGIQFMIHFGEYVMPSSFSHVVSRFKSFGNPFKGEYALNDGFQMINSYYAIYNGGWFGLGLGNSIQKKGFLWASSTDFMFSIVIEELGLIAALLILALLIFLIARIFTVGIRATSSFNSLMCIGIAGMMLIQVFVNVGGVCGIIPLTGVTFPFLSSGGSSLIVLCIGVGFALNISAEEKRKRYHQQQLQ